MKKAILITGGYVSLSLGVVGIFVPVLPTTPFLLLSAACFLNSSERLYRWLIHLKVFGNYISNYLKYRAISLRSKIMSISLLWLVIGSTVLFFISNLWIRLVLLLIAAGVTIHILKLRTLTREMTQQLKEE